MVSYETDVKYTDMTNKEIDEKAVALVIAYEKSQKREAKPIPQGKGYDVESTGRKIEVKGVAKQYPGWRLMEEQHFKAIKENDDYFLYVVEHISTTPKLYILSRNEVIKNLFPRVAWTFGLSRKAMGIFQVEVPADVLNL